VRDELLFSIIKNKGTKAPKSAIAGKYGFHVRANNKPENKEKIKLFM
jgi:hypothetical protein